MNAIGNSISSAHVTFRLRSLLIHQPSVKNAHRHELNQLGTFSLSLVESKHARDPEPFASGEPHHRDNNANGDKRRRELKYCPETHNLSLVPFNSHAASNPISSRSRDFFNQQSAYILTIFYYTPAFLALCRVHKCVLIRCLFFHHARVREDY